MTSLLLPSANWSSARVLNSVRWGSNPHGSTLYRPDAPGWGGCLIRNWSLYHGGFDSHQAYFSYCSAHWSGGSALNRDRECSIRSAAIYCLSRQPNLVVRLPIRIVLWHDWLVPRCTLSQVLVLIAEGLTSRAMADRLGVSRATVQRFLTQHQLSTGNARGPKPKARPPCPVCGQPSKKNAGHCGKRCAEITKRRLFIERWLLGEAGMERRPLSHFIQHHLLEVVGWQCAKCGWGEINPKTRKVPLTINHIDGDPFNHLPNNLEVLCPNCHSLTPNFGGSNRGQGRLSRRKAESSFEV
jgi:hypothetical protein